MNNNTDGTKKWYTITGPDGYPRGIMFLEPETAARFEKEMKEELATPTMEAIGSIAKKSWEEPK